MRQGKNHMTFLDEQFAMDVTSALPTAASKQHNDSPQKEVDSNKRTTKIVNCDVRLNLELQSVGTSPARVVSLRGMESFLYFRTSESSF